jgi:hypothetical protein
MIITIGTRWYGVNVGREKSLETIFGAPLAVFDDCARVSVLLSNILNLIYKRSTLEQRHARLL